MLKGILFSPELKKKSTVNWSRMTEGKPGLKLLKSELLAGAFLRRNELTVNKQLVLAELNKNSLGRE